MTLHKVGMSTQTAEGMEDALAAIRAIVEERTNAGGEAHLVSGTRLKWRREFNDATLDDWDVVEGAGQDASAGAGSLVITSGTTVNAETTVTSKQSFSAPFRAQFGFQISQKIANVEVYVEIVAENEDGTLDESRVAAWRMAGSDTTSLTTARTEVRNGGAARTQSANVAGQASQTSQGVYEIVLESDEVRFYSKAADSTATRNAGQVRQTVAPDPNVHYRVRYRVRNGGTAPASSTTFTSTHAVCIDYTEQQVEVSGGNGSINADQAVPVYSTGGSVTLTSTALATSATVAGTAIAKVLAAASVNNTLVKATAGRLYGYHLANTSAAWRYVKFYNKATAPVAGTDTPVLTVPIPPGGVAVVDRPIPISFATGIGYALTTGAADNDATAVAANDVVGHLLFI
jgi:hypothetical protein